MPMKNPAYLGAMAVDVRTGTAASNAVTMTEGTAFQITTESLTTAAGAEYALTITNSRIASTSFVLYSVGKGTDTQATFACGQATMANGTAVLSITNTHASEAFNGTLVISGIILNPKWV